MCGGTLPGKPRMTNCRGLSPRVRGNQRRGAQQNHRLGSIPACAGEPKILWIVCAFQKVYPRVCGGTLNVLVGINRRVGLSPRVRGNPCAGQGRHNQKGSIPACAGEPQLSQLSRVTGKVYPRVCGGTVLSISWLSCSSGLSPRVRGNPAPVHRLSDQRRSIPACAGEPPSTPPKPHSLTVYPRVCGGTHQSGQC